MTIHVTPIPSTISLTTHAFVLGETDTAGASSSAIAADSSLAIFNSDTGSLIVSGATGTAGVAPFSQRSDHTHTVPTLASPSAAVVDVQIYTSDDTWTKPACSIVLMEVFAGGGGGAGGAAGAIELSAAGPAGGGGAMARGMFRASDLPDTLTVTVGQAGASGAATLAGGVGGDSVVLDGSQILLKAYGGAGGAQADGDSSGGGGGGTGSIGITPARSDPTGGDGGNPTTEGTSQGDSLGGRGGKGGNYQTAGSNAEFGGGGGGGGQANSAAGFDGGSSLFGGPGGGSGGENYGGGDGGAWQSYSVGGGASGGQASGYPGADGTSRSGFGVGDGGGGGGGNTPGGAGGSPSGGGGGGGRAGSGSGAGGAGGSGEIRIVSF